MKIPRRHAWRLFLLASVQLAAAQTAGPLQRVANSTLHLPTAPPVFGYTTERAFGTLTFANPVAIATPPGETNRLFVVEQGGRIAVITNLASPNRTVFLDISSRISGGVPSDERGLLGLAFHPAYASNRFFYVFYTGSATTAAGTGLHDKLARFQTSPSDPNLGQADSEQVLIAQFDQANNHNGGDLHFGPDGYLYVALGDEGGGNDQFNNSQRIDRDFFAGILRIDVDQRPASLAPNPHPASAGHYAIPPDNPYVNATSWNGLNVDPAKVRTEFYAVGLRNPWRFSFDPATGHLYCADVGQNTREEIDIIVKGGNYGWNYREGKIARPGSSVPPAGFSALEPILDYTHGSGSTQGNSVTGGVVYRGQRFSQLTGAYVFADYVSGNLWALRYDGATATPLSRLAGDAAIAAFGIDPRNGDVLMADQSEDTIKRLVYSSIPTGTPLPPTLAETGAFADLRLLTPNAGLVPYDVNVPVWSDHAQTRRWFSVPDPNLTIGFSRDGNWAFPSGTVWIQHFEMELTTGVPESVRRLETRFLIRNKEGLYGLTYRWADSLTNATLVPEEGRDETLVVQQNGRTRTQVWHYPSRSECLACHSSTAGWALGFNTAQLNRDLGYAETMANQIDALNRAGYFATPATFLHSLRALAPIDDTTQSAEYRIRSYLAANCASCHQPGGSAVGLFDARITTRTSAANIINGLLINTADNGSARIIKPASLEGSMLLSRISTTRPGRMPPLATSIPDENIIDLVSLWITNTLAHYQSFSDWQLANFGSTNAPGTQAEQDADADGAANYLEFLIGSNPLSATESWKVSIERNVSTVLINFPLSANRAFELQWKSDLSLNSFWQALDGAGNKPIFPAEDRMIVIEDVLSSAATRFYRVLVLEP
ncbi:MAG: PQQ-dependent sugar dehydrogenase [Chloroflexi bacterium]|nr:PQQ-dependent sugar dehydrogenase [Chloroflexota bacterium]